MKFWGLRHAQLVPAEPARIGSVARSHLGLQRPINEDRVLDLPECGFWAVADGMGGYAGGDLAAQAAVDALRQAAGNATVDLPAAIHRANAAILRLNQDSGRGAGATLVVAQAVTGAGVRIAWVGDSRAYCLRGRQALQLTHDHTVVQELIDAGLLKPESAQDHPQAHVVTRALGIAAALDIATRTVTLEPGDRLLLCSDGLSRSLDPEDVATNLTLPALADRLLADALRRDGSDNISLVLAEMPVASHGKSPPHARDR